MSFGAMAPMAGPVMRHIFFEDLTPGEQLQRTPLLIYGVLDLALSAAFLAIWRTARDHRVFRSMSIYLGLFGMVMLWAYRGGLPSRWFLVIVTAPVLVIVAAEAMQVLNRKWTWIVWPICLPFMIGGWFQATSFLRNGVFEITQIMLGILIVQAWRQHVARYRLVIVVFFFLFLVRWTASPLLGEISPIPSGLLIGGWNWSFNSAAMIVLGAATLVIYVRDLLAQRREKERLDAELAASRAVQELLLPRRVQILPGFSLEAVYKPFGEVGGDFFQVVSLPDGGTLVAIGDVSGKGMPAALMVSLLVGALNTMAETSASPAAIMNGLNRRACEHNNGGFTTCLILRVDFNGIMIAANAGHLAPYLNGVELQLDSGFPLGLLPGADFAETTVPLSMGDRLVLMTDGVAEARSPSDGLFGFERAAALCHQSAGAIAHAAEEFGQEDDITVLTLVRI